jgi:uncharacterized protein YcbK (DUF882 family)
MMNWLKSILSKETECPEIVKMEQYKLRNFSVQEFVDPISFSKRGKKSISIMDWRMLWTADMIREYFDKPMTINNWHTGGNRKWSGIRYENCANYTPYSQHSYGRAIDFLIKGMESADVRKEIMNNPDEEAFKYITCIEDFDGMSWVHIDCRVLRDTQERYLIVS